MSVTDRVYNALVTNGERLTAKQIAARFNVTNPYNPVYELRNEGHRIKTERTVNSKGEVKNKYRFVS